MLVALGLTPEGRKKIIDFRLAVAESVHEWELFLTDLYRRGLEGNGLELISVDGGKGLLAALPTVYHGTPVQRCWAHKIRNVLDKVRKADREAVKRDLHEIMNASHLVAAPIVKPFDRPARRWDAGSISIERNGGKSGTRPTKGDTQRPNCRSADVSGSGS